jgi:hypothetical protein
MVDSVVALCTLLSIHCTYLSDYDQQSHLIPRPVPLEMQPFATARFELPDQVEIDGWIDEETLLSKCFG